MVNQVSGFYQLQGFLANYRPNLHNKAIDYQFLLKIWCWRAVTIHHLLFYKSKFYILNLI